MRTIYFFLRWYFFVMICGGGGFEVCNPREFLTGNSRRKKIAFHQPQILDTAKLINKC